MKFAKLVLVLVLEAHILCMFSLYLVKLPAGNGSCQLEMSKWLLMQEWKHEKDECRSSLISATMATNSAVFHYSFIS